MNNNTKRVIADEEQIHKEDMQQAERNASLDQEMLRQSGQEPDPMQGIQETMPQESQV